MTPLLRNNPGNKSREDLINEFVIRTKHFQYLLKDIESGSTNQPAQHYLIIGPRGAGKTTLVLRIKYAIDIRLPINEHLIPILFNEEQYNITDLIDVWENIALMLEGTGKFPALREKMISLRNENHYEERALDIIVNALNINAQRIVLFFENIDLFFKKIGIEGQQRLREVLNTDSHIQLVATATSHFEEITDYRKPFYNFFKVIELRGLTKVEATKLLIKIGELYGHKETIEHIIRTDPKRVESLRRLTGGVPRIISHLFQIFLDNENGKAIDDLKQLLDNLTYLYKAELDGLSSQQQKIIDALARNWDAIGVKEISEQTRIESKQVSSILQVLEKNQFVEVIQTKTKNNLYRLKERFMNIWYLMRFGRSEEKASVIWLVRFYDAWCDRTELAKHIKAHIRNLQSGNYSSSAALYMANTFLSCENISSDLKYNIYVYTRKILPREQLESLNISYEDLYPRVNKLIKEKKFEEAAECLKEISKQDSSYYDFASYIYYRSNDYKKAETSAEKFYELDPANPRASLRVGQINDQFLDNKDKAIKYYKIAIDLNEFNAAQMLGHLYERNGEDELALKYFLLAAEKNVTSAYMSLATYYFRRREFEDAEKYCILAIDSGIDAAYMNMGILRDIKGEKKQAIFYLEQALKKGYKFANILLGSIYGRKPRANLRKAEAYLNRARDLNLKDAGYVLGEFYLDKTENKKKGIDLLLAEVDKKNANAAHKLGHYFDETENYDRAEEFFLKSFQLGRKAALFCYTTSVFNNGLLEKRAAIVKLLEDTQKEWEELGSWAKISYAFFLLWDDQLEKSITQVLDQVPAMKKITEDQEEDTIEQTITSLTEYFILLIAKQQYNTALSFFDKGFEGLDFKQMLKPVYYTLMNYVKEKKPKEFLKAGGELTEVINELKRMISHYEERL